MARDRVPYMRALFWPALTMRDAAWEPPADVYRTPEGWLVKLDLAGVSPEEVQILTEGNRLTVRGRRRDWLLAEGCWHYQMEISYSPFERTLTLPINLERSCIHTEQRYGMLLLHIHQEESDAQ